LLLENIIAMPTELQFNQQARRSLKRGVDTVAMAVKTTLGPRGRNVAFDSRFGSPTITHDGVTVAQEITLPNPFENMGAQLLKEAAGKTNDAVGDGTSTVTVLAQAILSEGLKVLAAGANPMLLKRGLDKGAVALLAELTRMAQPVHGRGDIADIASISAADPEIGELIAEVMEKVGKDGAITVEEGQGITSGTEYTEGMQIDRGYLSPYFVTDAARMEAVLDEPLILLAAMPITSLEDVLPLLEAVVQHTKNVVIIAEDVSGEALTTLVLNKLRGTFSPLAIKAPGFGDRRNDMLQDIALLTGGTVLSAEIGRPLDSITREDLGRARKIIADKDNTTFIGGGGDAGAIAGRVAQIRAQIAATTGDFEREKLQERLAKLTGGVAVITVGAATELELKERKHRVEDALSAARAAAEEGIVPGGGVALLNARSALSALETSSDDERLGVEILRRALDAPLRQLVENAGAEGAVVAAAVCRAQQERGDSAYGYNVLSGRFGNLFEEGVIDPVKVTRSVVQNAVSIAGMLLTIEVLVADVSDAAVAADDGMDF
jgi:chaperonin GroEL